MKSPTEGKGINWKQELTKIVEKNRDDMTGLYDYKQIAESIIKLLRKK